MIWGAFGLFLAISGYFFGGEVFLIPVGIVFILIGIKQTVFNYKKIATLMNFIGLFVAITLGEWAYFFEGFARPGIMEATVSKVTPTSGEQPVAKAPTPPVEPTPTPPKQGSTPETYVYGMKCAKPEDLNNIEVGRNVRGIDLLLCPGFKKITIPYRSGYELGTNTLNLDENFILNRDSTKFVHIDFLADRIVLSPTDDKLNNSFVFFQILDRETWNQQINEKG